VTLYTESDAFGQVLRQDASGQQVTYSYDGLGRLLQTGHEYTGLGNELATDGTTSYTRDPSGNLIGAATSTAQRLVWTDQHTDVVGQFTPSGSALAGSATYDPLGQVLATSGLIGTLGYQSEYTDALTEARRRRSSSNLRASLSCRVSVCTTAGFGLLQSLG
jgi:YD repeat-containing protein